jgi:hypothetical protein
MAGHDQRTRGWLRQGRRSELLVVEDLINELGETLKPPGPCSTSISMIPAALSASRA